LSEVFFPALIGETLAPLLKRLGDLATVDEPISGSSTGVATLAPHLERVAGWFNERSARYSRSGVIVGADRDVAEGVVDLRVKEKTIAVPIAVVAQRGKNRIVEVRVYHATRSLDIDRKGPAPAMSTEDEVPVFAKDVIDALRRKDGFGIATALEAGGTVCEATGQETERDDVGKLLEDGAHVFEPRAVAHDLRRCAVECVRPSGRSSLVVIERGDSGLVRSVRIYDED
jgi:hypothetical protein